MSKKTPKWVEANGSETYRAALAIKADLEAAGKKDEAAVFWRAYQELNERDKNLSDAVVKEGGQELADHIKDAAKRWAKADEFQDDAKDIGINAAGGGAAFAAGAAIIVPYIPSLPTLAAKGVAVAVSGAVGAAGGLIEEGAEKAGDWVTGRAREQEQIKQKLFETQIEEAMGKIRSRMTGGETVAEATTQAVGDSSKPDAPVRQ